MEDALIFIRGLMDTMWNGLDSVTMPVLNVSFLMFALAVLFINLMLKFISVLTGGKQDKEVKGGRLDDNNNYIYRRNA